MVMLENLFRWHWFFKDKCRSVMVSS
jgi:hypothetical protein